MKVIAWIRMGGPVFSDLVDRQLLDRPAVYREDGLIARYLQLYRPEAKGWGFGLYGPKWIGDHYTLIELKDMGVDPTHPYFRKTAENLLHTLWHPGIVKGSRRRHADLCVAAMLLDLSVYCGVRDPKLEEIVDYILAHPMRDGGWNCSWDAPVPATKSSLHSTISVLEAFADCRRHGFRYRSDDIAAAIPPAEEFILRKRMFRSERTGLPIHPDMVRFHYPPRWKYDAFRGLDYFAATRHPFDPRMAETVGLVRDALRNGYVRRGSQYSGKIRFPLETGKGGRFNTLRALRILRANDPSAYAAALDADLPETLDEA